MQMRITEEFEGPKVMTTSLMLSIPSADGGRFQGYLAKPARSSGPGLILLQEIFGINQYLRDMADYFAEEGYVVLVPDLFWRLQPGIELGYSDEDFAKAFDLYQRFDVDQGIKDTLDAVSALRAEPACVGKIAALGYCLGGKLAYLTAARGDVDAAVSYYGVGIEQALGEAANIRCPMVMHFAAEDKFVPPEAVEQIRQALQSRPDIEIYHYPGVDHAFATPGRPSYDKPTTLMAYSRSLALLRKVLGPVYDLSQLWEKHCEYEFATRDVPQTMTTMVGQPYVNHVPTMTGGVGFEQLSRFYKYHFVDANPADTKLIPISRTIGTDRLVDEMLFCFTHDREIDWMLPGVAATGKYVEIPLVAIVNFRGDKLYHEHIYWDQASVLVQIGVLDPHRLPVAGVETAQKLIDETRPSNTLMESWASSAGKPIN